MTFHAPFCAIAHIANFDKGFKETRLACQNIPSGKVKFTARSIYYMQYTYIMVKHYIGYIKHYTIYKSIMLVINQTSINNGVEP